MLAFATAGDRGTERAPPGLAPSRCPTNGSTGYVAHHPCPVSRALCPHGPFSLQLGPRIWTSFPERKSSGPRDLKKGEHLSAQRPLPFTSAAWARWELNCQAQPRGAQMYSYMKLSIQVRRGAHSLANSLRSTSPLRPNSCPRVS